MTSLEIISDNEHKITHTMSCQEKSQQVRSGKAVQKATNLICRWIGKKKKRIRKKKTSKMVSWFVERDFTETHSSLRYVF